MAYSKAFLFLGLLFAFALLLSSEVISAREVAESTQETETELAEKFKGHPYRHPGHHGHHRHHEHGGYEHHHPPEKKLSEIDDDEHQDETDGFKHHHTNTTTNITTNITTNMNTNMAMAPRRKKTRTKAQSCIQINLCGLIM
ncbi:hypothetical protein Nepgr_026873 [Nepenthes gracilis]|uniref:Uncharacterized protein n=1 Tax=Nepenthes gracilis TaxID=150966 RepID=A0AAD3T8U6_NEPGR|nr:hypothetical protein Nepgr_026873 [Nepenthes gracilis]